MNEELKIREYTSEDKSKLLEILRLNVPRFFSEKEIEDLDIYLDHEIERYFIGELNGEIIGAGGINFENDYKIAKISWDYIHPGFHGLGFGQKLLKYRLALLKSVNTVETILVRTSQYAYKFYQKNGFVLKEVHKDFWGQGFDMYKMVYEPNSETLK